MKSAFTIQKDILQVVACWVSFEFYEQDFVLAVVFLGLAFSLGTKCILVL
jgi:hypothetical protein